ncbi:hypothetical protein Tco_0522351 [Tanacetum coccineum]
MAHAGMCECFKQTLDGSAKGMVIKSLSPISIRRFGGRLREVYHSDIQPKKACYKEPHEITMLVRKANETLTAFKERWTVETRFIIGVPEVMKISSFMDSVKSPELAKRFASNVPKTVNEMMKRLDEFVRAEEAYALVELPPRESRDIHHRLSFPAGSRDVHQRLTFPAGGVGLQKESTETSENRPPREKISERATIEILTRSETTSYGSTEITELQITPKGATKTEPYVLFIRLLDKIILKEICNKKRNYNYQHKASWLIVEERGLNCVVQSSLP